MRYLSHVYRLRVSDQGTAYLCRSRNRAYAYILTPDGTRLPDDSLIAVFTLAIKNGLRAIARFTSESGAFEFAPFKREIGRNPIDPADCAATATPAPSVPYLPLPVVTPESTPAPTTPATPLVPMATWIAERISERQAEIRAENWLYGLDQPDLAYTFDMYAFDRQ